jgi:hypothetical protein
MSGEIEQRLRGFARTLLERGGALVEWPDGADEGWAMLPAELAARLSAPELVRLSHNPQSGGLCANLATNFLERLAPLVEAEPRVGLFQIPEAYLKRAAMDEPVARAFTWLNAKVRVREAKPQRIEYHTWSFTAGIQSDDVWEDVFSFTLNSASGAEVALMDPERLDGLVPYSPSGWSPDTLPAALRRAAAWAEDRAGPFVARLESRLARDRKRLRDYYRALLRDTHVPRGAPEEPQKLEARQRAVELELRRKLLELDERYALKVTLTPLALCRIEMPVLGVVCEVLRKQADRLHMLYWNPALTALEPLACSACGASSFAVAFSDERVEPLCAACAKESGDIHRLR